MSKTIHKIGFSKLAILAALIFSSIMVLSVLFVIPERADAGVTCEVCHGSCGSSRCTYKCVSNPDIKCKYDQARFMCEGRIHTACNDLTGKSLNSAPDFSDPQYWCKSFQFDSNAPNGAFSQVFVGDRGEVCTWVNGKETCDPDDLDWDCDNKPVTPPPVKPPVNKPAACDGLSLSKSVVTSLDEKVTITVKGSDAEGKPSLLQLFAAVGGQTNKNPGDFVCTFGNVADPNYSFYCGADKVWKSIGTAKNSNTLSIVTNFRSLRNNLNKNSYPFTGKIEDKGINITANVTGYNNPNDLCSSNIARNYGAGTYFNNGAWNVACKGGCNVVLKYQPPAKPVERVQCNESCQNATDCEGDLICSNNRCRNASCVNEADCICPTPTPEPVKCNDTCEKSSECEGDLICSNNRCRNASCTGEADCVCPITPDEPKKCNESCEKSADCDGDLICSDGSCRNASCTLETDCTCPVAPSEPVCGDKKCNQDSETCENNVSCSNTSVAVDCRSDCTYCGDGILDSIEECDYNKPGTTNCSKECKIVEHPPTDTSFGGAISENMALISGFGMLFAGAGIVSAAVPLKKRIRFA